MDGASERQVAAALSYLLRFPNGHQPRAPERLIKPWWGCRFETAVAIIEDFTFYMLGIGYALILIWVCQ